MLQGKGARGIQRPSVRGRGEYIDRTSLPEVRNTHANIRANTPPPALEKLSHEELLPPRANLIKQVKGYCGLYAVLNSFETMEEVCQFLNIPTKQTILEEDLSFVINYLRDHYELDVKKSGFDHIALSHLLNDPFFKETVGISGYTFKSTNIDLYHLLTSTQDERNSRYLCFGVSVSNQTKRGKAVNNITKYLGRHMSAKSGVVSCSVENKSKDSLNKEDIDVEVEGHALQVVNPVHDSVPEHNPISENDSNFEYDSNTVLKEKTISKRKGNTSDYCSKKKRKVGPSVSDLKKTPVSQGEGLREQLRDGTKIHSNVDYHIMGKAGSCHASLIFYNSSGIPFRYDPGFSEPMMLLPHYDSRALSQYDVIHAVEIFIGSLLSLDRIYRLKINLIPREEV